MKKKLDLNQLAKSIVEQTTGEVEKTIPPLKQPKGKSGGIALASSMSKDDLKKRSEKVKYTSPCMQKRQKPVQSSILTTGRF